MPSEQGVRITWLGHAATRLEAPDGKVILIDPMIEGNPSTPEEHKEVDRVDLMLITHGHGDNMGEAVQLATRFQPRIIAMNELCGYLSKKGAKNCTGGNVGGTQEWEGIQITMVEAVHSSSLEEDGQIVYMGLAVGFVIRFPNDFTVYHAGDTAVFEGMRLIGRLHRPDLAILPIGDHFTMGPRGAAEAVRLLDVNRVIPIHYGTFPIFTGTPDQLLRHASDVSGLQVFALKPGESMSQTDIV